MRLIAAVEGRLADVMAAEVAAAEKAVSTGVRDGAEGLKTELRRQVTSAGLGARLANTWRSKVFPPSGRSISAAGFVWSKAPGIVGVYEDGAVIRSKRGLFLAIPLPAAGKYGDGGRKITPGGFERRTGIRLRFVYRRNVPSLLVADNARLDRRGLARANIGRRKGAAFTKLAGRSTVPVFLLVPQVRVRKRLDVAGAADRWQAALPRLVLDNWQEPTR